LFLRDSITDKNWQGGGSYSSFYGGMRGRARSRHPLQVQSIEYHSPGYIEVVGNKAVLDHVVQSIDRLISNHRDISQTYRAVYRTLSREGVLRADKSASLSSERVDQYIYSQSEALATKVGFPNSSHVFVACDRNYIVSRRVRDLARFYVEGRVKTG